MSLRESITNVDLFRDLPPRVLDEVINRGTKMKYAPGRVFVQQGSTDSGLQLILEGSAVVSVNGNDVATLGPGQYLGEISLIDAAHSRGSRSGTAPSLVWPKYILFRTPTRGAKDSSALFE